MSQENVEVVRRVFEALNRADLDALVEAYDPEVEIVTLSKMRPEASKPPGCGKNDDVAGDRGEYAARTRWGAG